MESDNDSAFEAAMSLGESLHNSWLIEEDEAELVESSMSQVESDNDSVPEAAMSPGKSLCNSVPEESVCSAALPERWMSLLEASGRWAPPS